MQLFIKTLSGKTLIVDCELTDTIENVLKYITEKEGIDTFAHRLIGRGMILQYDKTLADYNISTDRTLHLVKPLSGCKPVIIYNGFKENEIITTRLTLNDNIWNFSQLYPLPLKSFKDGSDCEWEITFKSNTHLFDHNTRRSYTYLFWEAETLSNEANLIFNDILNASNYLCFHKKEVLEQLDILLELQGLNITERNDFITFWINHLTSKEYVLLSILDEEIYSTYSKLMITPTPDQIIRVFMLFKPCDVSYKSKASFKNFRVVKRKDNVVVEWGAMHIDL